MPRRFDKYPGIAFIILLAFNLATPPTLAQNQVQAYTPPALSFEAANKAPAKQKRDITRIPVPAKKPAYKKPEPATASKRAAFSVASDQGPVARTAKVEATSLKSVVPLAKNDIQKAIAEKADLPDVMKLKLAFGQNQTELVSSQEALLAEILTSLKKGEERSLSIDAYATQISGDRREKSKARRIALARGLAVRQWFMDHGIRAQKIDIRALGNDGPRQNSDYVVLLINE